MLDCPTQPRRPCAVCICHCEAKICRSQIDKRPSERRTPQENSHPQNGAVNPRPQLEDRTKCFRQLHGLLPDINGIQLDHIPEDTLTVPSTHSLRVPRAVACKLLEPQKIDYFSGKKWERHKRGTAHGTSCGQP